MLALLKPINWKLVGLFFLKLFLYLIGIPILALLCFDEVYLLSFKYLFNNLHVGGKGGIEMQFWAIAAIIIYSGAFYLYVIFNKYIKSNGLRRGLLFLYIFFLGIGGAAHFKSYFFIVAIFGNWFYFSCYFLFYAIAEYFLPSFRGQLKK